MTAKDRARVLLLIGGLLVAALVTAGPAWAGYVSCQFGAYCNGTSGPDELQGTKKHDVMYGRAGNDTLLGRGGDDLLRGDAQADTSLDGNDLLYGGGGDDGFMDGGGSDLLVGGGGNDDIWALGD